MTYRKTWFSYVVWAVYAGLCVMLLAFMGYYLYLESIAVPAAGIGVFLIFPVAVGVYWGIRETASYLRTKYTLSRHTAQMLEAFAVAFCMVFGLLRRIFAVLYTDAYYALTDTAPAAIRDIVQTPYASYYDMALVRTGGQLEPLAHGAGYLYVLCVSAVCSFLGNKLMSAVLLEAVIQIISMILGYLAVRKAAGKLPACIVLAYLSFSQIYLNEMYRIAPDNFVFMLYLAGLLLILQYNKDYCGNRFSRPMTICGAVLIGVVTGILVYLDLRLIVLFVFLIGLFTGQKTHLAGEPVNHTGKVSAGAFLAALVSGAGGLCVMFGIAALYGETGFARAVSDWLELYRQKSNFGLFGNRDRIMPEFVAVTLMITAASFLVFEFFRNHKEQNYTLWLLAAVLTAPTPMALGGILPYTMLPLFQWSALAGLGLQNCIFGGQAKVVQAKIEEINASAEQNTRYIENPLPLPRKHVKKEMDYQYPVADEDMKYDIEVDVRDDLDIS